MRHGVTLISASLYAGPVAEAVRRLKYRGRPDLARQLAAFAKERVSAELPGEAVLVPVPIHARRLAERGYNQSALLATCLARQLDRIAHPRALRRVRETEAQAGLGRSDRLINLRQAFEAWRLPTGRRVVLVDDVLTTGATAAACIEALGRAGVEVAAVVTVARARRDVPG
jgi:ComF family protein